MNENFLSLKNSILDQVIFQQTNDTDFQKITSFVEENINRNNVGLLNYSRFYSILAMFFQLAIQSINKRIEILDDLTPFKFILSYNNEKYCLFVSYPLSNTLADKVSENLTYVNELYRTDLAKLKDFYISLLKEDNPPLKNNVNNILIDCIDVVRKSRNPIYFELTKTKEEYSLFSMITIIGAK
jgi:hypothetical protein